MPLYLVTAKKNITAKNGQLEKGMNVEVNADHPTSICTNNMGKILIDAVKSKYNLELRSSDIDTSFFDIKKL